MKKYFALLFCLLMLAAFVGCGNKKEETQKETTTQIQTESEILGTIVATAPEVTGSTTGDVEIDVQPTAQAGDAETKQTEPEVIILDSNNKTWCLLIKNGSISTSLPMREINGEPALPLVAIAKVLGVDVEWLTDTTVSLWYGDQELFIDKSVENFGVYLPYGSGDPIREIIGEEVYVDLPSASFALNQWGRPHISVDTESKLIVVQ